MTHAQECYILLTLALSPRRGRPKSKVNVNQLLHNYRYLSIVLYCSSGHIQFNASDNHLT